MGVEQQSQQGEFVIGPIDGNPAPDGAIFLSDPTPDSIISTELVFMRKPPSTELVVVEERSTDVVHVPLDTKPPITNLGRKAIARCGTCIQERVGSLEDVRTRFELDERSVCPGVLVALGSERVFARTALACAVRRSGAKRTESFRPSIATAQTLGKEARYRLATVGVTANPLRAA